MKYIANSLLHTDQTPNLPIVQQSSTGHDLQVGLSVTFIFIGAVSLMMLVIAGFRYTISSGDPTKIADAKRAMIYTMVGIVVSASAYIIVQAVLGQSKFGA